MIPSQARFSKWKRWEERHELPHLSMPGVYVLSITSGRLNNKPFSWRSDIVYVGMTNSIPGLAGRLRQFDNTTSGKPINHGGAARVRFKHRNYGRLVQRLFVSVLPVHCDVKSNQSRDLRLMGKVVELEYICLARYAQRFNRLPEFNDKRRSPKHGSQRRTT